MAKLIEQTTTLDADGIADDVAAVRARTEKGGPDGSCTTDAEGFLWNAEWGASRRRALRADRRGRSRRRHARDAAELPCFRGARTCARCSSPRRALPHVARGGSHRRRRGLPLRDHARRCTRDPCEPVRALTPKKGTHAEPQCARNPRARADAGRSRSAPATTSGCKRDPGPHGRQRKRWLGPGGELSPRSARRRRHGAKDGARPGDDARMLQAVARQHEILFLQWTAREPPYRIALVNGFIGNACSASRW